MPDLVQVYADLAGLKAELWNAAEERLRAEFGLSLRCFLAMSAIDRHDRCQAGEVAAELAIGSGAARNLIGRMEADGYCRRCEPRDALRRAVELTPKGRSLVTMAGLAFDDELRHRLGAAVPAPELGQFAAALRRLRRPGVTAVP